MNLQGWVNVKIKVRIMSCVITFVLTHVTTTLELKFLHRVPLINLYVRYRDLSRDKMPSFSPLLPDALSFGFFAGFGGEAVVTEPLVVTCAIQVLVAEIFTFMLLLVVFSEVWNVDVLLVAAIVLVTLVAWLVVLVGFVGSQTVNEINSLGITEEFLYYVK